LVEVEASPRATRHWLYSKNKCDSHACSKIFASLAEGVRLEDRAPSLGEASHHPMVMEGLGTTEIVAVDGEDERTWVPM
jgi:hypothetical protein